MDKQERVCQFYKLSVRKDGGVFPCCLAKGCSYLGNIFDTDIINKIESKNITCECELFKTRNIQTGEKPELQRLHIEFSNECQAHCVCCQQHKEIMENEDEHLNKLTNLVNLYHPQNITVIGGEVLIQPKSLTWLEQIKKQYPNILFDIVTNLCIGENTLKRAAKIFNDMTVSILGFSDYSYNKIMGLDFMTTMKNYEYLKNNTNIKLRPKYLAMPTNLYEINLFFDWALKQNAEKIYLHNIREFMECCNLNADFWVRTFKQVEQDFKKILLENKDLILQQNRHFISMHKILADNLKIDNEYLKNNGFENTIKITS